MYKCPKCGIEWEVSTEVKDVELPCGECQKGEL